MRENKTYVSIDNKLIPFSSVWSLCYVCFSSITVLPVARQLILLVTLGSKIIHVLSQVTTNLTFPPSLSLKKSFNTRFNEVDFLIFHEEHSKSSESNFVKI